MDGPLEQLVRKLGSADYPGYCAVANDLEALAQAEDGREYPRLKVAVLRNFIVEPLIPVLKGEIAKAGFLPEIYTGDLNTIAEEAFDPGSGLYEFSPDIIMIFQWPGLLAPKLFNRFLSLEDMDQVSHETEQTSCQNVELVAAIRKRSGAHVLINNFPHIARPTLGILDAQTDYSEMQTLHQLNHDLVQMAREFNNVFIVDYREMFSRLGVDQCYDARNFHRSQAPLARGVLVPLGETYGHFIRALKGRAKKCLVLDCDNTLWGGVIGEDGMAGIRIGTTAPGSWFRSFQEEVLNLHDRGVMIALCSKNNEADVLEVLREHDEMLLRETHLSGWQINWDDKASNIRALAGELNIGLDSMVFIDDNEFECRLVKEHLPEVEVMTFPKRGFEMVPLLRSAGFFDSLTYSGEDRQKSRMYRYEKERRQVRQSAASIEDYLRKLNIVAEISEPRDMEIPRISQLTQKTNQFNLTTKRYAEGDIKNFIDAPDSHVLRLKLKDDISELGIIAVAILRMEEQVCEIDSFLMSCRALGRGVEKSLLAYITEWARRTTPAEKMRARFLPTAKNQQVANFYGENGFEQVPDSGTGSIWELSLKKKPLSYPDWVRVNSLQTWEDLNGK